MIYILIVYLFMYILVIYTWSVCRVHDTTYRREHELHMLPIGPDWQCIARVYIYIYIYIHRTSIGFLSLECIYERERVYILYIHI